MFLIAQPQCTSIPAEHGEQSVPCLQSSHHPDPLSKDRVWGCKAELPQISAWALQDAPLGKCHAHPRLGYSPSQLTPLISGTASESSLLVQKLPVFLEDKQKCPLCPLSANIQLEFNILQRCYRRKMSKNLPHWTTLRSGYTRNYLAGLKTPVASLKYHLHPCCASFKKVQGPHFNLAQIPQLHCFHWHWGELHQMRILLGKDFPLKQTHKQNHVQTRPGVLKLHSCLQKLPVTRSSLCFTKPQICNALIFPCKSVPLLP